MKNILHVLWIVAIIFIIAAFWNISFGVLSFIITVIAVVLLVINRNDATLHKTKVLLWLGISGVVVAAIGTIGMVVSVQLNCRDLDPRSTEGIHCFGNNYNSSWGIYHLISKESDN